MNKEKKPRNSNGTFAPYKISLNPSRELGYFIGLILGDGWIYFQKATRNYTIAIESTKRAIIEQFCESAYKLGLHPSRVYKRIKTRRFPNGEIRTDILYRRIINSEIFYKALRPYKQDDYQWKVPSLLTTRESLFGFIGGFFDAEGSVSRDCVVIGSKYDKNLVELKQILQKLGFIFGKISVKNGILRICGMGNIRLFIEKTEIRLKKREVQFILENRPRRHMKEEYEKVMRLRKERNWGGRRISKETKIPISTIEDWIYKNKKPWELKVKII